MQLRINSSGQASGDTRRETENGVEYLIAPAVIAREGVLDYSDQRDAFDHELLPKEEFTPASRWNGLPVLVDHPTTTVAGTVQPTSTTTPGTTSTDVGEFRDADTGSDGATLGGEVWIRANERDQHGPGFRRAFDDLEEGEEVQVSPGYGVGELDATSGRHNGESYAGVQRDLDPDHVAVVISGKARCSVAAGCSIGQRANAEQNGDPPSAAFGTPLNRSENNGMTQQQRQNANFGDGDDRENATLIQRARDAYDALGDVLGGQAGRQNARSTARTPEYDRTLAEDDVDDGEFVSTHWMLDDYVDAYAEQTDEDVPSDLHSPLSGGLSQDARNWIAKHTLLGNADADTEPNLLLFNVVSPDGVLHESKLRDVIGSDGARATLSEGVRESARDEAGRLLSEEFGDDDEDARENAKQRVKWESENGDTRYGVIADQLDGDDQPDEKVLVAMYEYVGDSGESSSEEKSDWENMTDEDGNDQNARVEREKLTELGEFPNEPAGRANSEQDESRAGESGRGADTTQDPNDMTDPETPDDPTDEQKIEYLVSEDGPNLDRENMEPLEGEDCLDTIYNDYQRLNAAEAEEEGEDGGEEGGDEDRENADTEDETDETLDMTEEDFQDRVNSAVTEALEERENSARQDQLVERITANSEYDAERLNGKSVDALEIIAEQQDLDRQDTGAATQSRADMGPLQTEPVRANAETEDLPPSSDDETYDAAVGGDD